MVPRYYTYRIYIVERDVRVEVRNPDDKVCLELSGAFRYTDANKMRLRELYQVARATAEGASEVMVELGETLFATLFDDPLCHDFFRLRENARNENALLRVELDVNEKHLPDVAALPWEFMRVPPKLNYGTVWLGSDPDMIFSRRRALWRTADPIHLKVGERLRIALAVAAPKGLGEVRYQKIWETLEELASKQPKRIELLDLVNPATTKSIDRALEQKPHIFHFIGHGQLQDEHQREIGQIALVDAIGGQRWLKAHEFGELFNRHPKCVVVLQACEGAALSESEAFVGVASQVIQQNVPVVVAMQYEISNVIARRFVEEFYRRLAENEPVDKAVQEGRRYIALSTNYETRDFATPVLFMRVRDGRLFNIQPGETENRGRAATAPLEETQLEALYFEGLEFLHTDEYERALECFERVANTRPDYRDAQAKLTEARRNHQRAELEAKIKAAQDQANWDQAIEALQALIALCPDEPDLADRLAQARRQMELKKLWEDTAELHKRGKWRAVIKSFEKMRAIDSGLTDRENWLAEAQQALKLKEIQQMVELHRQEALGHFNTKEWGKALHALNSILKLDPGNERATRLRDKAQAEVAQAEAAALLAERYDNAKQAMGGEKWEDAVVLLKLVSQENAGYRDVASLLERASEQFADTQAELDVTLSVNPKEAKPDSQVTWTLTINNYSPAPIGNIVAREEDDRPLADPFALDPDESKEIAFTSELTTWAARRRRIRVEGTSPLGRPLQAEGKASVSSPPKKKVVKPQPPPPPEKKVVNPQPAPPEKKVVKQQPPPTEETGGYRDALRQAKETVDPLDHRTNHLIALFEKGEKHYRIARGLIRRPHDWDDQFSDWQDAVARLKPDEIVMVSLASATPDAILKEMATIAREIERRIGVAIPTQELRNL